MYLTNNDLKKNRFHGVDRKLFSVTEKSEKFASDSESSSVEELTGEEKL
jgi:hypothetical protein